MEGAEIRRGETERKRDRERERERERGRDRERQGGEKVAEIRG